MTELKHPYPGVIRADGSRSYGGSQMTLSDKVMQRCGCGIVAAADLLRYLHCYHKPIPLLAGTPTELSQAEYESLLQSLRRRYFPLFYPVGMNGLSLAFGLNRLFRKNGVALSARWDMSERKLWTRMEEMLQRDIPVILSIGPNFPRLWKKGKETLYRLDNGRPSPATETRAHYVTVTALDENWMRISSWGKEYYLSREEYERFRSDISCAIVSNILYICEMNKTNRKGGWPCRRS